MLKGGKQGAKKSSEEISNNVANKNGWAFLATTHITKQTILF